MTEPTNRATRESKEAGHEKRRVNKINTPSIKKIFDNTSCLASSGFLGPSNKGERKRKRRRVSCFCQARVKV